MDIMLPRANDHEPRKTGSLEDPFNWSQLPPDEEGAELSKEARIWKVYVGEADKWDAEKADGWNKSLDVLLVFAALFSAISTSFLIESSGMLKQDPNDVTAAALVSITQLLTVIATNSSTNPKLATPDQGNTVDGGFVPSQVAVVVNTLWFLSLALSISASFLAMLAKDWCHSFTAHRTGHHRDQAHRRQRKWTMIKWWKMEELILMLPSLIHLSLALFATGLCIYLWDLNSTVAIPVICVCATAFAFYALSSITAAFIDHFPYTTMVTWVLRSAFVHNCYSAVAPVARRVFYYLFQLIIAFPLQLTATLLIALAELVLFPAVVIDLVSTRYIFNKLRYIYAVPISIGVVVREQFLDMTEIVVSRSWSSVCSGMKYMIRPERFELSKYRVTSLSLSWLLEYCETPKSVALTLQAIAGATQTIPKPPLIKHGARWQILQQLVSSSPGRHSTSDISLYSRALDVLRTQPEASPNDQPKADLGSSDIQSRIWDLQEHQDSQIGVFLKHEDFLPSEMNLRAMAIGSEARLLSLELLKEDKRGSYYLVSIELFESIINILTKHVESGHQQLHLISLYSMMNAAAILVSVSAVPAPATRLYRLCIECLSGLSQSSHLIDRLEDLPTASPTEMAIWTMRYGTHVALVLCALLCIPSQDAENRARSLVQANTCLKHVLRALVADDASDLERQFNLFEAGLFVVSSAPGPHDASQKTFSNSSWCSRLCLEFLHTDTKRSSSDAMRLQKRTSGFYGAIRHVYQVMGSLDSPDQPLAWLPRPVHPTMLAIACLTQSSERQTIFEGLISRSGFPTHAQFFNRLGDYTVPPVFIIYNTFNDKSPERDPYFQHLAATQLWFFVYYYHRLTPLDRPNISSGLGYARIDMEERLSENFREELETFLMDSRHILGTYSYRVVECILQARRQRLGEQFSVEDQNLLNMIESELQDVPLHFRGLSSLSPPPIPTAARGVEIAPVGMLPQETSPIAPSAPTSQPTSGILAPVADDLQNQPAHVALPIGPPAGSFTNFYPNSTFAPTPVAGHSYPPGSYHGAQSYGTPPLPPGMSPPPTAPFTNVYPNSGVAPAPVAGYQYPPGSYHGPQGYGMLPPHPGMSPLPTAPFMNVYPNSGVAPTPVAGHSYPPGSYPGAQSYGASPPPPSVPNSGVVGPEPPHAASHSPENERSTG